MDATNTKTVTLSDAARNFYGKTQDRKYRRKLTREAMEIGGLTAEQILEIEALVSDLRSFPTYEDKQKATLIAGERAEAAGFETWGRSYARWIVFARN